MFTTIGTMSPAILAKNSDFAGYANDEMNVVYAKSINPNTPELWEMLVTRGVVEAATRL